ncbi:acyl-CoA thioesterase [Haloflavibacter putidus]|uniref:Acyl-CoA thioesterase n=1 Tax=Haloflavibacter putidus TaxID=2576776 RepID=A0A507ZPX9_9FLAO|nr:acyl-CoA thioesterase [Haloflavibacter putidus]TQD36935.1 acyl-CoA thioesterase [Haloflavibacter putidus]
MQPISFQYIIEVPNSAIDQLDHVNNVKYLQWIQDVAQKHWENKTSQDIRQKVGWVVLDHFIEYKRPAFKKEELILKTWIHNYGNIKCERRTEIIRKSDNKLVVKAKTTWCLINLKTQKPTRITPEITQPYFE